MIIKKYPHYPYGFNFMMCFLNYISAILRKLGRIRPIINPKFPFFGYFYYRTTIKSRRGKWFLSKNLANFFRSILLLKFKTQSFPFRKDLKNWAYFSYFFLKYLWKLTGVVCHPLCKNQHLCWLFYLVNIFPLIDLFLFLAYI
jgi:hypothetical protein